MNWKSLFYYSKGERRVLILLLFIITLSGILLSISHERQLKEVRQLTEQYIVNPDNAPRQIAVDTAKANGNAHQAPKRKEQYVVNPANAPKAVKIETEASADVRQPYQKTEKYPEGTKVELNTADTTVLKKVPGIGSFYARSIVKYRDLLGGFYKLEQLMEVYRMDEERYLPLKKWFYVDTSFIAKLPLRYLPLYQLKKHPYLNEQQAQTIYSLRQSNRLTGLESLRELEEFTGEDLERLSPYLSF